MAATHDVAVTLADGTVLDAWDAVDITLDMLSPGSAWTLSLWWSRARQSTWQVLQRKALRGARLLVAIDGAVQLAGRIETRLDDGGHDGGMMTLSGRDLAGPLIDGHADPALQFRNATLQDVLTGLARGSGVAIQIVDAAAMRDAQSQRNRLRGLAANHVARAAVLDVFRVHHGESRFAAMDRACRKLGYLLWTGPYSDAGGPTIGLVVDKPADAGAALFRLNRLEVPGGYAGNILRGGHKVSLAHLPTTVTAFTHSSIGASQDARLRATVTNASLADEWTATDLAPVPHYLWPSHALSPAAARHAAEREIAEANATAREYTCTVQDFAQGDRFYALNSLAAVQDDFHSLSETMVITQVHFHQSHGGGQYASLAAVPRGAIVVVPEAA